MFVLINEDIKISIIIPIYNCLEYLKNCIASVKKQTISPKEVICIDDGSTDGSYEYLKDLSKNDLEILVIQQENQGAGIARNKGLAVARGDYIAFLDADDTFDDVDALEKMYELCEKNKISVCRALKNNTDGTVYDREKFFISLLNDAGKPNIINYIDYQDDYDYMAYIYKRELLLENDIKFPHYRRFQDPPFLVRALYKANRIIICDKWLYSYRQPMGAPRFNAVKVADMLAGMRDNLRFAINYNLDLLFFNTLNRIEYEYHNIIVAFLPQNIEILNLLIEINSIVINKRSKILRPLVYVQKCVQYKNDKYEKELCDDINNSEEIIIYGAGHYGQLFYDFLLRHGLESKVSRFVVSNDICQNVVKGLPVVLLADVKEKNKPIYIAVDGLPQNEIYEALMQQSYDKVYKVNILCIDEVMRSE